MGLGRYMDGCGSCMKYTLFIINLLTLIGGILIIGLGVWIIVDKSAANNLIGGNLHKTSVYILIAMGVFITLLSCFGCYGAIQEVKCLLITYFIIVFIIFVIMLVGGILAYVFRSKVDEGFRTGMKESLVEYYKDQETRESWDSIQTLLHCCGIDNYTDWQGSIPGSCCRGFEPDESNRPQTCQQGVDLYRDGCHHKIVPETKKWAAIIGGVGIGVACVMLLGMIFSCGVARQID